MKELVVYSLIPVVCALIGWLTNFLAVKMIFRPRRPVNLLGLKIQGLMPRRQTEMARQIGEAVETRLLTHADILEALKRPEAQAEMETLITEQMDAFFTEKLGNNPMVAMFLSGDVGRKVKQALVDQLKDALPKFLDAMMDRAEVTIDLKEIVQKKIEDFDLSTLEAIVYGIARKELKTIEILGGVLGFLVGLAQTGILIFAR